MALNNSFLRYIISTTKSCINHQQIRRLPRWSHRTPAQVIEPVDYDELNDRPKRSSKKSSLEENASFKTNINWKQPNKSPKEKEEAVFSIKHKVVKPLSIRKTNAPKPKSVDMLETIIDEDGNFIYTKMDDNDVRISNILVEIKSKQVKEKRNLILLEGKRLIKEALNARCKLEYILFSRMKEVDYLRPYLPKMGAKLYKMPYKEMQMWSDLTTNPGIMGIFKIPDTQTYQVPDALPLTIVCDNVREPNNLGAVLRTSSGVGCEEVVLTKGCTNLWYSKVLRTACGAHFKLKLRTQLNWERLREELPADSKVFIADNNTVTSDHKTDDDKLSELIRSVPLLPYYSLNFCEFGHIVLIIGGETEGISEEAYQFAAERKGLRLNVPLSNDIDSLNTGTALGVIAFEIKRQLLNVK